MSADGIAFVTTPSRLLGGMLRQYPDGTSVVGVVISADRSRLAPLPGSRLSYNRSWTRPSVGVSAQTDARQPPWRHVRGSTSFRRHGPGSPGELPPRSSLPEVQLSEQPETSCGVREALRALQDVGLVEVLWHRGAFVTDISPRKARELSNSEACSRTSRLVLPWSVR